MTTYDYMASPQNLYGDKVIVENNGTKFLIDKNIIKNNKFETDYSCGDKDLWKDNFEHTFNFDTSVLEIEFTGSNKQQEKIKRTSIVVNPLTYRDSQKGFDYLNYKVINFENYEEKVKVPISLTQSKFESSYPVSINLKAFTDGESGTVLCYESQIEIINHENYVLRQPPTPFFNENLISAVYITNPVIDIGFNNELDYLEMFLEKRKLNALHTKLPIIDESTVALLHADISPLKDSYEWKVKTFINIPRVNEELVVGLFGDVKKTDLQHIERIFDTLRVVAPSLKISYSLDEKYVTLPIHFADCTKEFSEKFNDCYKNTWGFYMPVSTPKHGWIYIDSSLKDSDRLSVLTHELGHALGLNHNLCTRSVMSYSPHADEQIYFTHVDLMMLQALYTPDLALIKDTVSGGELIEHFSLSEERVLEKRMDISSTCHRTPGAYDYLIDMQLGKEW